MKATREQVLAMAREVYGFINTTEEQLANIERLVHLAQQFERDQLRAIGGIEIRWRDGASESLYLAPPDQSAEVSMTPAASIFKDEVARLNAEVDRLRGNLHAMKQNALRDVERIAELERQQAVLVEALEESQATMRQWRDYNFHPHCFPENFNRTQLALRKVTEALASVKGNACNERALD